MKKILFQYLSFLWKSKLKFILYIFILIVWAVLSNIQPYFYKLFIDRFSEGNLEAVYQVFKIVILVGISGLIIEQIGHIVGDWLLIPTMENIRLTVFKKIQDLDFTYHVNKSTGSLVSAVKRGQGSLWNLFYEIRNIIQLIIGFMVVIFFFSRLNLNFLYVILISGGLFATLGPWLIKKNMDARREFNKESDEMSGMVTDNLINFETVKMFAKEDWELNRLKKKFIPWKDKLWDFAWTYRYFGTTFGLITLGGVISSMYLGIRGVQNNRLSTGDFIMIIGFIQSFFNQMSNLIHRIRSIAKDKTDLEKYFGILKEQSFVEDPKNPIKIREVRGRIDFNNVSFSYPEGKEDALNNFTLNIKPGESIALVGESGAGKTTVTKLLLRCYDPLEGRVMLDGKDIRRFKKSDLRKHIGVVPQEPVLFNQSIEYNIGYGKKNVTHKEVVGAAKMALLHKFITSLPKGYETKVGERGIKLSGGQKQRMAIARMILSNPEIIIFDEATSQLDSESEKKIQQAFWKAAKNKTTLIIAHRLSTITKADRIIVMEEGEIIETGSHNELIKKKDSRYNQFWQLQTK
jgi:ABC-type multidrug transport system fused ATPase/permease subunit